MEQPKITTIKIFRETKIRLDKIKSHKRETYDDIIQKLLGILNTLKTNPFQASMKLEELDRARKVLRSSS